MIIHEVLYVGSGNSSNGNDDSTLVLRKTHFFCICI